MSGLFGGKSTGTTEQVVTTLNVQTSSYGVCIPYAWGTVSLTGNLIWYGDFVATAHTTEQGGKGGGVSSTSYTYSTAWMLGLCESVVTSIPTVWADKTMTSPYGLGIDLMGGSAGQSPWSYMTTHHPDQALNYPDLCYAASGSFDLANNSNLPNLRFEVVTATSGTITGSAAGQDALASKVIQDIAAYASYPASRLGDLTQYINFTGANGLFISPALTTQQRAADYLGTILEMTYSAPVYSEGLLKVIPYGDTDAAGNGYTFSANVTPQYALTDDDFLPLDGELPIELLYNHLLDPSLKEFKRTLLLADGAVVYSNNSAQSDYKQSEVGTPDYSGLPLNKYISVI